MIVINNKRKFFGLTLRQILSLIKAVQKLIDLKTSGKLIYLKTSEGPLCYISDQTFITCSTLKIRSSVKIRYNLQLRNGSHSSRVDLLFITLTQAELIFQFNLKFKSTFSHKMNHFLVQIYVWLQNEPLFSSKIYLATK